MNENRHAIEHKLNYEVTKDTKMDFGYMQTDLSCISKRAIKEKKPTLATESREKKKCLKNDKWYTKAKWLMRKT